jgi:hypothetical protein
MGCDIHSAVEVFDGKQWNEVKESIFPLDYPWNNQTHCTEPFSWRSYGMFSFLAGVQNYSYVPVLSDPRGLPADVTPGVAEENEYHHSCSWLSLRELMDFDYDKTFEDRRCMKDGNGAADAGKGNGKVVTFREFLRPSFFRDIDIMKTLSDDTWHVRVVFGFDN